MQLQFRHFPELFVYTVTVPFSRWIILIYRSSVYRHPPALPPAPLSSLVPLCATLRHSCYRFSNLLRAGACKQGSLQSLGRKAALGAKSLAKTAFLGAERTKSLEKTALVQREQNPWNKNSPFGCRANKMPRKNSTCAERPDPWKKTALLGAERTKSLEKNSTLGCRANQILG